MTALVLKPNPLQDRATSLLLASGSAARKRLLENAGLAFGIVRPEVDEHAIREQAHARGCSTDDTALELAIAKALAGAADSTALVIGSDQMLSCEGQWYDKPTTLEQAARQLQALRGRTHTLHTAVVLCQGGQVVWQHVEQAHLSMRAFSDSFLEQYLALEAEACLSCVGAYRLEGPGLLLFEQVRGDSFSIQGLPLLALVAALRDMKVLMT
ncbi:MAG: Maf family protein [Acetobacter papayae]|uniref:Maf family protein n=1 Tax=Acetobacter papayae TaxID=1076592 RepID=UPI0039E9E8B8